MKTQSSSEHDNATGPSLMTIDVSGKRLELFKEAVPNLSRVAVLTDVTDPFKDRLIKAYQASGERLGLSIWPVLIKTPEDIEPEFSKIAQVGANGIVVGTGGLLFVQRARIGASALNHKIPVMAHIAEEVPPGLLMSYGQDFPDFFRRAVVYTDKIRAANQVQAGAKSQDSESIRPNLSADAHHERRRSDRITIPFAALHESAFGP